MTPENNDKQKPLSLSSGKLELKKKLSSQQLNKSSTSNRSKTVTVEVKRKRTFVADRIKSSDEIRKGFGKIDQSFNVSKPKDEKIEPVEVEKQEDYESDLKLTNKEKEARLNALKVSIKKGEEEKKQAIIDAENEKKQKEEEEALKLVQEKEQEEKPASEETTEPVQEEPVVTDIPPQPVSEPSKKIIKPKLASDEDDDSAKKNKKSETKKTPSVKRREDRRRSGKLTITQVLNNEDSDEDRQRSLASLKRAREKEKQKAKEHLQKQEKIVREVTLPETITVQELANRMAERSTDVIRTFMNMGEIVTINKIIDADTAELIIAEFGHKVKRVTEADVEIGLDTDDEDKDLTSRPPVVTIMGHVDHGKTSLLDALRQSNVARGEAGGITQHIGAYQVVSKETNSVLTFLDTPGHEAFTAMRSRGAKTTDIVVLVVAADDGVQPQTIEAINHAKAAQVPIIVAINKIDVVGADTNRVKTELLSYEIQVEDLGGEILCVEVSALKKQNLNKLIEFIALQSELLDLKANPNRSAQGAVIEAKIEKGRGSVASVLVQKGTLNVGDIFIAGDQWGRVRALIDHQGKPLKKAGPSTPVEVLGLQGTPMAGDDFVVVDNESRAREITEYRQRLKQKAKLAAGSTTSLEQMFTKIKEGSAKELPLVIKADVQGSVEAIAGSLEKLSTDEVAVKILHSAVGVINETDISLAQASDAIVIGFNVRATSQAKNLAESEKITISYYSVIYDIVQRIKDLLSGLLDPAYEESFLGYAEIREVFNITKVGKVAGCRVTDGLIKRRCNVRILRDNVVIHEGALKSLKHHKEEVKEIRDGYECGMAFENYQDIKPGDVVECFEVKEIARTI